MKTELLRACKHTPGTQVKLPWMESPRDVRVRIEGQATQQQYNKFQAAKSKGDHNKCPCL
jgi:hypothetical protein